MLTTTAPRPLQAHALFQSTDLDEARERVAAVFCPHRLETLGRGARLNARQHHLRGERLSLNYIEYGAKALIAPGELERFYLVQIPLAGGAMISNGGAAYYSSPRRAAVLNPHRPTTMIWDEGCAQLLIQIDRQAMMDHLSAQLGARADRMLTFDGPLDLTSGAGAAVRRLALYLATEADAGRAPLGQGLMARQVESALMSGLLESGAHDHAAHLGRARSAPRPRHLRLAESFIEANLRRPLTVEEVAEAAGISARALQLAFRQWRGTTPLGWWRDRRLDAAHADLMAGKTTVTDTALAWGFAHFGRFSESYRARFGIPPSETLRAARGGYQD
ncbi:MAG: AraC family transcriptional regulator [Rhodobacterales bacterium]|nr:AraC family transcriptional regulator [Rhodobacterales bacterium]MDX5498451.1 AraC family transcriptional regulator [Rhodobacterales bacterium]